MESGKDGTLGPTFKCVIGKQLYVMLVADTDDHHIMLIAKKCLKMLKV
jgi:hypothetical protein